MYSYISAIFLYMSLLVNVSQLRDSSSVCAVDLGFVYLSQTQRKSNLNIKNYAIKEKKDFRLYLTSSK